MKSFAPENFATRPALAQVETELRRWLRTQPPSQREQFLRELWTVNWHFAIELAGSSQLPNENASMLLKEWLAHGQVNSARSLVQTFGRLLGTRRFWKIVGESGLSEPMARMLEYHRSESTS
jgi:hypothetical protein